MAEANKAYTAAYVKGDTSQAAHWHLTFNNPVIGLHYQGGTSKAPTASDSDDSSDDEGTTDAHDVPFEILLVLPTEDELKDTHGFSFKPEWFMGQMEVGDECGTPHIHVHMKANRSISWAMIKKAIKESAWDGAHIEKVKDIKKHMEYVTKTETRVAGPYRSPGTPAPSDAIKGKRQDLIELKSDLDKMPLAQVWERNFSTMIRHFKGAEAYLAATMGEEPRPRHEVFVLYGKPGSGKSTLAVEFLKDLFPLEVPFTKPIGKWFDGYAGQAGVILDDFDGCGQSIREIKNIFDKTICRVEIKGRVGGVVLRNKLTVVTTNTLPSNWFDRKDTAVRPVDVEAVLRRCHFFRVEGRNTAFPRESLSASGLRMKDLLHDTLQRIMEGETVRYQGVNGERLMHDTFVHIEDNNGLPNIFQTPNVRPNVATPRRPIAVRQHSYALDQLTGLRRRREDDVHDELQARPFQPTGLFRPIELLEDTIAVASPISRNNEIWSIDEDDEILIFNNPVGGSPVPEDGSNRAPIEL
jgi:hypothetical protein